MPVILGLIGAAIGWTLDAWATAVLGFGVGFLFGRLVELGDAHLRLRGRVDDLQARYDSLERELLKIKRQAPAPAAPPEAKAAAPPRPVPPTPQAPAPTASPAPAEPRVPPAAIPTPMPAFGPAAHTPVPPVTEPAPAQPFWLVEFFTTGNVVAKVGMVIVFFGVAFLVRYAADRGLLPIEFRLMAVAAGSLVLLGIGWFLRRSRPEYAMVLQGGAVGLLYLTIFAAFRLYALLPAPLTFALLLTVVAFSGVLAVVQNALSLAAIGVTGGFLAPILASTGGGSHVALFSYYAVLNLGVLGIAWFRAWRFLNWLAFVFTFGIGFLWGQQFYQPAFFSTTEPFLIFFFLLFLAVAVLFAHRQAPELRGYIDGTLVFGVPAIAFTMQSVLVREIPFGRAYSAVALSALYLAMTRALWRRDSALRQLAEALLALGVVFLILAVPLAFDGHATAAAWALEGTGLVWIGVRQNRLLARLTGSALLVAAGAAFAVIATPMASALAVLNARFLACAAIAAGSVVGGRLLSKGRDRLADLERPIEWVLLIWGLLWWFGATFVEVDRHVGPSHEPAVQLLAFAGSAVLTGLLARAWDWRAMRLSTMPMGPLMWLAVIPAFFFQYQGPLINLGWAAWLGVIVASYLLMYWFERAWPSSVVTMWHAGTAWLVIFLATWSIVVAVRHAVPDTLTWSMTIWCLVPALILLALRAVGPSLAWPVQRFSSLYREIVPLAPAAGIILWVGWASTQSGNPDPLPYVPIVNPLELVQAIGLIVAFLQWGRESLSPDSTRQNDSRPHFTESPRRWGLTLVAGLAFVAINMMVGRVVHFYWHVPFEIESLLDSSVFQAGISILWGVTAGILMALARIRISRPVWMIGAGVLAALIVKLFLIDLGNVGGVARIVSFLATGVLILVIGYFAPAPPKTEGAA
ncbi:MAG TPA: DUF2339 domain-containing protein [Vicinamibacterales bacterium]|jgi:uncharacterized membrane protein